MKKLLLVRHGETNHNRKHLLQGQLDIPLNAIGLSQATLVAKVLKSESIDEIWSSPLTRSCDTADAINQHHKVPIQIKTELLERSFGDYEGLPMRTIAELKKSTNIDYEQMLIPNSETVDALYSRAQLVHKQIEEFKKDTLLIVAHSSIFRALIGSILKIPLQQWFFTTQHNTCINTFYFDASGNVQTYQLDDHGHLFIL